MPLLINPAGRIVAIDDIDTYKQYLAKDGFKKPTPQQEEAYTKERYAQVEQMKQKKEIGVSNVYLATVSEGGKDGYGVASKLLEEELQELGCNISRKQKNQKIGILFHNPYSILRMENQYRFIYTMFESDKLPDDWRDYLEAADLIIVPSQWCAEVFEKFGFKAKVIPLGYNSRVYKYIHRKNKREAREDFVFLHYNAFNIRKGFLEVFKAFNKAFEVGEPVKMIFKTTLKQPPFPILKEQYPNIEVISGPYEEPEMLALMERSDCFVFPSRGEGFGIPPLEAMATGMPAIVPNAHGISEYFNREYMYEAVVKETCPAIYSRYKGQDVGRMTVCDVDQLAQQMRYVYEHQDEALEKGRAAADYVKKWTAINTADILKSTIDHYLVQPTEDRPIINLLKLEEV